MNHLNSVLLEGVVQKNPVRMNKNVVRFVLESCRYFINSNGRRDVEMLPIPVESCDVLADKVAENITEGLMVRVVGRLKPSGCSVAINAEHIEYKASKTLNVLESVV